MEIALESRAGTRGTHGYCGPVGNVSDERRERVTVMAEAGNEEWIALVDRVREHQDRAAFAELFRHFAPRVKAFLMKSSLCVERPPVETPSEEGYRANSKVARRPNS